ALAAGDRRALHDEDREAHLDVPGVGPETLGHVTQHAPKRLHRVLALAVQNFHERDMCVPLKLCGRRTYMLKLAMVCCSPADRSLTRTGWLMSLTPTRLMGSSRVSRRACTSSTSVTAVRASWAVASGGVMSESLQETTG